MPSDDIILEAEDKMEKSLEAMLNEFKGIRTGRASPGLVENVKVEYYGAPTSLKQIASISIPDPRLIMIKPFDPSSTSDIEKALQKSDIGINPQNDGKIIRLAIPPLSEERRKKMSQLVKDSGEEAKVSIRNIRRDANKQVDDEEKEKVISEDEKFKTKEEVQKLTERYEGKVSELVEKKTKEVMEI